MGHVALGLVEIRQIERLSAPHVSLADRQGFHNDAPLPVQSLNRFTHQHGRHAQHLGRPAFQIPSGEIDVSLAGQFFQEKKQARLYPHGGFHRKRHLARHAIGGLKADAGNITGQPVGVAAQHGNGAMPVALEDFHRLPGRDVVILKKERQLTDVVLLRPGPPDAVQALAADAPDASKLLDVLLDDIERPVSELVDDASGHFRPQAPYQPRSKIF